MLFRSEYDDNFHLTRTDKPVADTATSVRAAGSSDSLSAPAFVLKVMHPARESALIDLQCRALQHLAGRAPQIRLPRVCPARSGELFTQVTASDGSQRLVWLLTYIAGKILAEARPHSEDLPHEYVGGVLARRGITDSHGPRRHARRGARADRKSVV